MIYFWPSLCLLAFFLAIFLECRALAGRATIPLRGFLGFFVYGCVGASLISILVQQIPYLQLAPETNAQGVSVMPAVWLTGPIVEELAKALPVIVLAFLTSAWRRLSIADLTLAGFASGAGFGFVESNLEVLANGKLPSFQHLFAFGYQTAETAGGDYTAYFAGHAVYPALVGLAAGVGLRLYPRRAVSAWIPAALALLLVCFDHGMFNWKTLHPADGAGGFFLEAPRPLESFYWITLHGWLETWLLPIGLLTAQFVEGRMCARFIGRRADLVLPHEQGSWVINEWIVAVLRLRYGRAVFQQTLTFFRRRRAFAVATLEAHRNPANRILAQYALLLEQRLLQERAMLADPPSGALVPPRSILARNVKALAWRWRWVMSFLASVLLLVSLLSAESAPEWLRAFLFGRTFTAAVVVLGLGVALWRSYAFLRAPRLDPVACEGAAYADRQTRVLLVVASLACAIAPAIALVLGWKALAPGAAYLSGALAAWIGQGGNLYITMALGAIAGSMEAEPPPVGAALRDEIDAGEARIRRMERQYQKKISLALPRPANENHDISPEELSRLITKLDAEREMQGRRKRALESSERQEFEMQTADLGRAVEQVIEEFERLRVEFDTAEAEERRRLLAFGQGFNRYLGQIERELNSCDSFRQTLQDLWRTNKTMEWTLRVAQSGQNAPQSVIRTFLPDLDVVAGEDGGSDIARPDAASALTAATIESPADLSVPSVEPVSGEWVAFDVPPEVAGASAGDIEAGAIIAAPVSAIPESATILTQEESLAPAVAEADQGAAIAQALEIQEPLEPQVEAYSPLADSETKEPAPEPQDQSIAAESASEALPEDQAPVSLQFIADETPLSEVQIGLDHNVQAFEAVEDLTITEIGTAATAVVAVVPASEPASEVVAPQSAEARGEDQEFQQIFSKFLGVEVEARRNVDDVRAQSEPPPQNIDAPKKIVFGPVAPILPPDLAELLRAELLGTDDPLRKDVAGEAASAGDAVPFSPQGNTTPRPGDDKFDLDVIFAKLRKVEAALIPAEPLRLTGPADAEAPPETLNPELPPDAHEAILAEPVWRDPPKLLAPPVADLQRQEPVLEEQLQVPADTSSAEAPRISAEPGPAQQDSTTVAPVAADSDNAPSNGRGIGRGKFGRAGAEKKPQAARAASAGLASFRPAKFYGAAKDEKANAGPVAGIDTGVSAVPAAQGHTVSIRSSKFFRSARVPAAASKSAADTGTADASPTAAGPPALGDVLTEYFAKSGEAPPPMQTMDSETFQEVLGTGRLDTTRRGAAAWTYSEVPRRGDFAIRLNRGADRYVEFVPSNVTFGQTPRYYPRRVGVGTAQPYIPIEYLEYFDAGSRAWRPIKQ